MIPTDRVCELVSYDPATGVFIRLQAHKSGLVGRHAGHVRAKGAQINLDGTRYLAHRLAWVIMTGEWPLMDIDHKDGNASNNSWSNLRLATKSQNAANAKKQKNTTSGFKGVYLIKSTGKYRACVRDNKRQRHLGVFETAEEASLVAGAAARKLFGEFYRAA